MGVIALVEDGGCAWVVDLVRWGRVGCRSGRGGWPRVSRWQQALVGAGVSGLAGVAWRRCKVGGAFGWRLWWHD